MIGSFRSDVHPFTDRVQYRWAARETPQRCLAPQPASSRLFRLFFTLHLFGTMRARQFACRRATPRFRAAEKRIIKYITFWPTKYTTFWRCVHFVVRLLVTFVELRYGGRGRQTMTLPRLSSVCTRSCRRSPGPGRVAATPRLDLQIDECPLSHIDSRIVSKLGRTRMHSIYGPLAHGLPTMPARAR